MFYAKIDDYGAAGEIWGKYWSNRGVQWHLGYPRPAVLDDVLGIVPPDLHGLRNG